MIPDERHIQRICRMLEWMIDGQFQHGIIPGKYHNITPEWVEQNYNVQF